jgi:aspartyl-tRNA(Asn)/glutamyl-tRNA(Gln) amidotransferase subunit B
MNAMNYETIIGLEVHAQLLTRSKMFCGCSADYASAPPNTHVCPVCLGMPGVLPVINKRAVEYTVMTALALNCTISEYTKFDRKNYPYPDLMKGYQISQYDAPIGRGGWLDIEADGTTRKIGITRVHLEEDVAKLQHRAPSNGEDYSLVDVNRSGVPLMEIVGEPDLRSPEEARQYLIKLRSILQYLEVSTGNMEEGSFRCDANISIRPEGSAESTAKVEVKNMNSFRAVYQAMDYEAGRQRRAIAEGKKLVQETRGWVEEKGKTVSQRSKESAHDYRYFPEPDLPPLHISRECVEEIRACQPAHQRQGHGGL